MFSDCEMNTVYAIYMKIICFTHVLATDIYFSLNLFWNCSKLYKICYWFAWTCSYWQLIRTKNYYCYFWFRGTSGRTCLPLDDILFLKKNLEDTSPFRGASGTPLLDFRWRLPWVSKPGWTPFMCFLACVILRLTSVVTPADCIEVKMVAEPFWSMYLQTCLQALVEVRGSNPRQSVPYLWFILN